MDTEQPASGSAPSIESRMAAYFQAPEAAPEEPQAPQPQPDQSAEAPEVEPISAEAPGEDDGLEDFDVDGTQYKLPRELKAKVSEWKEGALRREDYTRKTQEAADLHRQVSVMAETMQARQQFEQHVATERTELSQVQAELARYKQVDWANLDIDAHLKLRTQMEQLKERSGELEKSINTKAGQYAQWADTKKRELLDQGQKFLQRTIKGWGPDTVKAVTAAAESVGYSKAEIEGVFDVRFVQLAHKAAEYDKLMSGKQSALASAQKAPPVVKPGASTSASAAALSATKSIRQQLKRSGSMEDAGRLLARFVK
jgi:hypothetical protein